MALTAEQTEVLQSLANMIKQSSGGFMTGDTSSGPGVGQKTEKKRGNSDADKLLDEARKTDKQLETLNKSFKDLAKDFTKDILNNADLKKLPANLQKSLEASTSKTANELASSVNNLEDVLKVKENIEAQEDFIDALKKYQSAEKKPRGERVKLRNEAKALGIEFKDLLDKGNNVKEGFGKLEEETTELRRVFDESVQSTTKFSRATNLAAAALSKHSAKLKESFDLLVEETRIMRERAANDAKYSDALFGLGISMKEWSTILADNRATQQAMAKGGRDFTEEMISASNQMVRFSVDNVQAAKTTAQFAKNISGFGVGQANLTGAMDEQIKMYKDNFRVFDMTAEAFGKYTEELIADTDIRNNLSMMAEKERKGFILSIQARESERLAMGYLDTQVRELTKIFARMGGETPKERMKKAAKQRALLGALGMGDQGAELQRLMVGINQLQGTDKADAMSRIEEIQRNMANTLQQKYSEGLGTEMFFRAMADRAGVTDLSRQIESLTLVGKEKGKAEEQDMRGREVSKVMSDSLVFLDTINGFQKTSVGLLIAILAAIIGKGIVGGALKKGLGKVRGGISKAAGKTKLGGSLNKGVMETIKGARGGGALKSAARLAGPAGAVLAAGAAGYAAGTAIYENLDADNQASLGDFIGKGFDNVLSFFGNDEAQSRLDTMEKAEKEAEINKKIKAERARELEAKELNDTLKKLTAQLKVTSDQGAEQTDSVKKSTTAMTEQARRNNFGATR